MRYTVYIFLLCINSCAASVEAVRTLPHVEQYGVIRPLRLSGRRSLSDQGTDSDVKVYPDEIQYELFFEGKNHTINLKKNRILIGNNYTETYYLENGSAETTSPNYEDHCYYHGHIQDIEDSSVSVGICAGIRGFVRAGQQVYLIEPLSESTDGDHALYRQEHLRRTKRNTCGDSNNNVYDEGPRVSGLFKPNGWKSKPHSKTQRFVEMFLVVDNAEYNVWGGNRDRIRARMLEVANHVDKLYRPLNIRVMLVGLEVWNDADKFLVSVSADDTLTRFLKWRQESLLTRFKHDNAQFVTGVDFLGDTVGLATKFAMCAGSSGAVNQDHNLNAIGVASTIAHEMGHNLGLSHDVPHCTCGPSMRTNCVMSERVGSDFPELFSSCSLDQLSVFLENANPSCLLDTPSSDRLYGGPVCGNAFLDLGEECDCGTVEECKNRCCNATTCRLTEGSQCAHGECCKDCQVKQTASLCRGPANDCDLAEYCTGDSEHCPKDAFKMNGISCDSGQGYCYNGQCPSHQQHCKRLWGPDTQVGAGSCFQRNTFGKSDSHCGRTKYGYKRCADQDIMCGKIFCTGGNEYPITGLKAVITSSRGTCNIAGDHSETEGLSMVPTGTKCAPNKVCFNNACQDVKVYGSSDDCSRKCNNHGVCNHQQQCYCDPGWLPPYCDVKRGHVSTGNVVAIAASAGVILPGVLLALVVGLLLWHKKAKTEDYISKKKGPSDSGQMNPLFQNGTVQGSHFRNPPQISQPTFMESSATQVCTSLVVTVVPTRPPPQPPKNSPIQPPQSCAAQMKPRPPTKPLPPLHVKQASHPAPPPVPPMKPTGPKESWKNTQMSAGGKTALKPPPTMPRR